MCNSKVVQYLGRKTSDNSLVEIWECGKCRRKAELSAYFTDEQPMEKIAELLHKKATSAK